MIAVFPGSFDPITLGHIDIINNSLTICDKLIIGVGVNHHKKYMFDIDTRIQFIQSVFNPEKKIIVKKYSGLTIDFCQNENAFHIIRGIRNSTDFQYEQSIAFSNQMMESSIKTIFITPQKNNTFISSTIVREIIHNNKKNPKKLQNFLPSQIISKIYKNS